MIVEKVKKIEKKNNTKATHRVAKYNVRYDEKKTRKSDYLKSARYVEHSRRES